MPRHKPIPKLLNIYAVLVWQRIGSQGFSVIIAEQLISGANDKTSADFGAYSKSAEVR